jgi:hypothetical protein
MTVVEMIHSFWLKAKTLDVTNVEAVKSFDVVTLLNNSVDILIDELVRQKAWQYLRPISVSYTYTVSGTTPVFDISYSHGIQASSDHTRVCKLDAIGTTTPFYTFRNYIRSQSKITRSAVPAITDQLVANEEIPQELIHEVETSGTNVPMFTNPKAVLEGSYLIVIGDGYTTVSEVTVVFVRIPSILDPTVTTIWQDGVRGVVTTCELPTELHQRIVDIAVDMYYSKVNVEQKKQAKQ